MSNLGNPFLSSSLVPLALALALPSCMPPAGDVTDDGTSDDTSRGDTDASTGPSSTTGETEGIDSGSSDAGASDSSSGSTSSGDTDGEPACGNHVIEAGEDCDGIDLAGATCRTQGFGEGTLACSEGCAYDTSGCSSLPAAPELELSFSAIKQLDFGWAAVAGASFYRLEESIAPGEPFVPLGGDVVGESISLTMPLHLRHQASYRLLACNDDGCTGSAPVQVMGSLAEAVGYFKASNPGYQDHFGVDIALSDDGNTLVVAAVGEDSIATGIDGSQSDHDAGYNSGAVYVFVRDDAGAWSQQAYIKASNTGEWDSFGTGLALSGDGNTLAVGADLEDSNATGIDGDQADDSAMWAGAVYVFTRDQGTWSQAAYVKASNTDADDSFGATVSLSDDGNTLAVGAPYEDGGIAGIGGDQADDSLPNAGAVYVLTRNASTWSHAAYLKASNPDAHDRFGASVALSGDGSTLAVGAYEEDGAATGIDGDQASDAAVDAGAVYVFVHDGISGWSQEAYVKASNTDAQDLFGAGLALSDDGDTLAVGAYEEDGAATGIDGDQANDAAANAGAVYVFVRDGVAGWSQEAYVKASNTGAFDGLGPSLALSADGNVLAMSAFYEGSNASGIGGDQGNDSIEWAGAVYVLERDATGAWAQAAYVKAPIPGVDDFFGAGVALTDDGRTLAVSANGEDGNATGIGGNQADDSINYAGAVYLY